MTPRKLPDGQFQPGDIYKRRDLHAVWGGQQQGGISTPAGADYALLFTGESGNKYGYRDEWRDSETYDYCGEGQEGDQELLRGNWTIADRSPEIHLFKETKDGFVEYVHQMYYADHDYKRGSTSTVWSASWSSSHCGNTGLSIEKPRWPPSDGCSGRTRPSAGLRLS